MTKPIVENDEWLFECRHDINAFIANGINKAGISNVFLTIALGNNPLY